MTVYTLTGHVTDTMGASATDTVTLTSTAAAPPRLVKRCFMENRIQFGSTADTTPLGPKFQDVAYLGFTYHQQGWPITLGQTFEVLRDVTFTGVKIYKAPNATGTDIPVKLWSSVVATTTNTELGSAVIPSWVADDGGWRDVPFPTPVNLVPGTLYIVGYYSHDDLYSYTPWVWNAQNSCVWPLQTKALGAIAGVDVNGSCVGWREGGAPDIIFPTVHHAHNFYIDPQVQWEEPLPGFNGGTEYWDQWTNYTPRHAFPVAVFYSDPENLVDYYDIGVNTLMAGYFSQYYLDKMALTGTGNSMDWWPGVGQGNVDTIGQVQAMSENPALAESVQGYLLDDEPDAVPPYRSPALLRSWVNGARQIDSTRPIYCGFTAPMLRNQTYAWLPSGATAQEANEAWRAWLECSDVIGADDYVWFYDNNANGKFGVWTYATQVRRLYEVSDNRIPVFVIVETCSGVLGAPDPENIRKAMWAGIIAGARGIICFDHRFGNDFVSQDFGAMLRDPPMRAMMVALSPLLQSLGPALQAPDLGLITAWTSTNKTQGPLGGVYGVPLHYTTRTDGTYEYAFVQAIRPGSTTGTVTIPTWGNEVVGVIEPDGTVARTETVSFDGVITDDFTDYAVHIYRRSPSPGTPPTIATTTLGSMSTGVPVSLQLIVIGTTAPSTFAVTSGMLPAGLSLSTHGVVTGTPTASGTYSFTVTATNVNGSDPQAYSGSVALGPMPPVITTTSLGALRVDDPFSLTLAATGTAPIAYTVTGGTLPAGLSLSLSGVLSGMPTTSGPYSFTVTASNVGGIGAQAYSGTIAVSLGVYSFFAATTPTNFDNSDVSNVELGFAFATTVPGNITALRFYKNTGSGGVHYGRLWQDTPTLLASEAYTGETASGWQELTLSTPVAITPGNTYYASVLCPNGIYSYTPAVFTTARTAGPLYAVVATGSNLNGRFNYSSTLAAPAYPAGGVGSASGASYMVDVVFQST